MIIDRCTGSIWDSGCQAIVVTVNTVGVMGKGIALDAKTRYPECFAPYKAACDKGILQIGSCLVVGVPEVSLIMFPTKLHWRNPSKLNYVEDGLVALKQVIFDYDFESVAIPALGCGLGGLDWTTVHKLIVREFETFPSSIHIYGPQ